MSSTIEKEIVRDPVLRMQKLLAMRRASKVERYFPGFFKCKQNNYDLMWRTSTADRYNIVANDLPSGIIIALVHEHLKPGDVVTYMSGTLARSYEGRWADNSGFVSNRYVSTHLIDKSIIDGPEITSEVRATVVAVKQSVHLPPVTPKMSPYSSAFGHSIHRYVSENAKQLTSWVCDRYRNAYPPRELAALIVNENVEKPGSGMFELATMFIANLSLDDHGFRPVLLMLVDGRLVTMHPASFWKAW